MRTAIRGCGDIERCLQRLNLRRGGPRDLSYIALTVNQLKNIAQIIHNFRKVPKQYDLSLPFPLTEHCGGPQSAHRSSDLSIGALVKPQRSKELIVVGRLLLSY